MACRVGTNRATLHTSIRLATRPGGIISYRLLMVAGQKGPFTRTWRNNLSSTCPRPNGRVICGGTWLIYCISALSACPSFWLAKTLFGGVDPRPESSTTCIPHTLRLSSIHVKGSTSCCDSGQSTSKLGRTYVPVVVFRNELYEARDTPSALQMN